MKDKSTKILLAKAGFSESNENPGNWIRPNIEIIPVKFDGFKIKGPGISSSFAEAGEDGLRTWLRSYIKAKKVKQKG